MKVKGLTLKQVEACARKAGAFKLDNVREEGRYVAFVLRMRGPTPPPKERKSTNKALRFRSKCVGRMMWGKGPEYKNAVCFHGFEAFMREVFRVDPQATIRSCRATYLGLEDFERKYGEVGDQNVGSPMHRIAARDACLCEEN